MILPHFSHLETCNGSYMGMKTLTLALENPAQWQPCLLEFCSNDYKFDSAFSSFFFKDE